MHAPFPVNEQDRSLYTPLAPWHCVAPLPPFRNPECKMVKGLVNATLRAHSTLPRYLRPAEILLISVNNEKHQSDTEMERRISRQTVMLADVFREDARGRARAPACTARTSPLGTLRYTVPFKSFRTVCFRELVESA